MPQSNNEAVRADIAVKSPRKKRDTSDITIAGLGLALGITCALFPWYIFFNQEKFGIREFTFNGRGSATSRAASYQPDLLGKPFANSDLPQLNVDFFPTATLASSSIPMRAIPQSEQPHPEDRIVYRLMHVANGRAMIEDEDGLWVVQRGSYLPDGSRVAAIERRKGEWVLVTTLDRVLRLTR